MASDKEQRQLLELSEKLGAFLENANNDAKMALDDLRRNELDSLVGAQVSPVLVGYNAVAAMPTVTIATINFRNDIDLDCLRRETTEAVRAWITAAAMTAQTLLFMLESPDGILVRLRLGIAGITSVGGNASGIDPVSRLRAAFPGIRFGAEAVGNPIDSVKGLTAHALVTGIPLVRNENEIQTFPVDRLIRGMRGRPFAYVLTARPLARSNIAKQLEECREMISQNHEQITRSLSKELGASEALTKGVSAGGTAMVMDMAMKAVTAGLSATLPGLGPILGFGASVSAMVGKMTGTTFGGNVGTHLDQTRSRSRSVSSSMEQLDAFAEAYDEALREQAERFKQAFSEGAWETSAHAFARNDAEALWLGTLIAQNLTGEREAYEPFRVMTLRPGTIPSPIGFWELDRNGKDSLPLHTCLTSSEMAAFMGLPMESHPGLEVRRIPRFSVQPAGSENGSGVRLGRLLDRDVVLPGPGFGVDENGLASHLLVAGITGSGKSTTMRTLLAQLTVPFLVLEPAKNEYRRLTFQGQRIRVFTAGDEHTAPLRLNPFEIPEGTTLHTHIDTLTALFNAAFPMEGPMAALVEQGLWRVYELVGWDVKLGLPASGVESVLLEIPTMDQFYQALDHLIGEQNYAGDYGANIRGALLTRIASLRGGPRGALFNTNERFDPRHTLEWSTVIEMSAIGSDETKMFLTGLLLWRLYRHFEYEAKQRPESGLRSFVVVEEAHRLFRRTADHSGSLTASNTRSHSIELFESILAEARAYGMGIAIVDQMPLRLSDGAVKNTATKIIHRLSALDDAEEMGGAMGLSAEDSLQLTRLRIGEVLAHCSDMESPAHVRVDRHAVGESPVADEEVRRHAEKDGYLSVQSMPPGFAALLERLEKTRPGHLLRLGQNLFMSILCGKSSSLPELWNRAADAIISMGEENHEEVDAETAKFVARHAVIEAMQRRHYLRKDLAWYDDVKAAWRSLDLDDGASVFAFRRTILKVAAQRQEAPPPWVAECHPQAAIYWAEARQQAAAIRVEYPESAFDPPEPAKEWDRIAEALRRQFLLPPEFDLYALFAAAIAGVLQEWRSDSRHFDGSRFENALSYFRKIFV
jgi:hypothetical protein